jgi:hypothetical protein
LSLMNPDSTSFSVTSSLGFVRATCKVQKMRDRSDSADENFKLWANSRCGVGHYRDPFPVETLVNFS